MSARNFKSTLAIFNGELFNDVLNDNIINIDVNEHFDTQPSNWNDDKYMRYYNNGWMSPHRNFLLKERKEGFKQRIEIFNKFNLDVQNGVPNMYYIYAMGEFEETLTKKDFDYTCENLPKYVIDHLIIIGGLRKEILPWFKDKFRCITYNFHLGGGYPYEQHAINDMWRGI